MHRKRILSAEAALMPPESVAAWLKALIPNDPDDLFGQIPTTHEIILFRRKHPLIDLALAKYGFDERILRRIFSRGNSGVRCAALANRRVGPDCEKDIFRSGWLHFNQFENLIKRGTKAELSALMLNEFIKVDVLEWLFQRKSVFMEIEESRWQYLIFLIAENPRLEKEYEGPMDGWAEYIHSAYAQDAWKVCTIVSATESWANVLVRLYSKKLPRPFNYEWVDPAIERWSDDPQRKDPMLSNRFWLRTRIGDFIEDRFSCRDSGDLALRMSFYRSFTPKDLDEVRLYYDKDKKHFLDAALCNEDIFVRDDMRKALHDLCWNEGSPDLLYANLFEGAFERMGKKFPYIVVDDVEPETKEMTAIRELQDQLNQLREDLAAQISTLRKKWF